jgi:hypothetical protein
LVAELDRKNNTIRLTCEKPLEDMWVLLDERMVNMKKEVIIEINGVETNRAIPAPTLGALLMTTSGPDSELSFPSRLSIRDNVE